jgi:hypothetical protein
VISAAHLRPLNRAKRPRLERSPWVFGVTRSNVARDATRGVQRVDDAHARQRRTSRRVGKIQTLRRASRGARDRLILHLSVPWCVVVLGQLTWLASYADVHVRASMRDVGRVFWASYLTLTSLISITPVHDWRENSSKKVW